MTTKRKFVNSEQERMDHLIKKFQRYVRTYNKNGVDINNMDKTFILDMLYGIGIAVDPGKFSFSNGFEEFKNHLRTEILAGG